MQLDDHFASSYSQMWSAYGARAREGKITPIMRCTHGHMPTAGLHLKVNPKWVMARLHSVGMLWDNLRLITIASGFHGERCELFSRFRSKRAFQMVNKATFFLPLMSGPSIQLFFFSGVGCGCLCFWMVFKDIAKPGLENWRDIPDTRTNILLKFSSLYYFDYSKEMWGIFIHYYSFTNYVRSRRVYGYLSLWLWWTGQDNRFMNRWMNQ